MIRLLKNELIKIFKRKNIYILLAIGLLVIFSYNIFQKLENEAVNIEEQYERAYKNDQLLLENYDNLKIEDSYEDIVERMKLEQYAIKNNIKYNILINTENSNVKLPTDARNLLIKTFKNFDIAIIFIIIYLASTIISEEYNNGTIKYLLTKPHTRVKILLSKIIASILIIIFIVIFIILFQYLLGGFLFGFDSYSLEAIKYNKITQQIQTMSLINYMGEIILSKMSIYLVITMISLLFGVITNNIALNILISLIIYIISTMVYWADDIIGYLFSFILLILLIFTFKNKDIKNE